MDKAEYKEKLDEINRLAEEGDFAGAAAIVDDIDWRHVKSVRTLCIVGEIYEANKRYDDAIRVLKYAYKRSSVSKTVLYRLAELSARTGDAESARAYAGEFREVSPNDSSNYILDYKISRVEGRPLEDQIRILEDLKEREYSERWAYELARLYFRNGQEDKCVDECDDMILWFSEGRYVTKAMELKMQIRPLTPAQQKKYAMRDRQLTAAMTAAPAPAPARSAAEERAVSPVETAAPASVSQAAPAAPAPVLPEEAAAPSDTMAERRQAISSDNQIQTRLADSIRAVLAGSRAAEAARLSDDDYSMDAESYSDEDVRDYVRSNTRAVPFNVRSLEAEADGDAGETSAEDGQMTIDDFREPQELDLKALFNETTANLASAIASGDFEKTDTVRNEDEPAVEETPAAEEAPVNEEAPAVEEAPADEEAPAVEEAPAAEEAPVIEEALVSAEEPPLGLTREFNFSEELRKAMDSGESMAEAARSVSARASEEAAAATEDLMPRVPAETEIPAELFADEQEEKAAPKLADLSLLTDDFDAVEESRAIIDDIMEKPESLSRLEIEPRRFNEVETKVFSYFAPIPGVAAQVTQALADVHNNAGDKTSRSGNIIVVGRQSSGKTRLADAMILAICHDLKIEGAKIAHIIAEDLNKKDPVEVVARMAGGFLVIEGAGALSEKTVGQLNRAMDFRTDDLVIFLEDEKADMNRLLEKYPEFAAKFTSRVVVPVFTNDELVTFARTYCKELGYKMDEMAILALYTMIGDNQKDREPVTVGRVQDMIDTAILRADKAARRFGRKLGRRDIDDSGRIMLHEKDFNF